jgi:hypothetical protein
MSLDFIVYIARSYIYLCVGHSLFYGLRADDSQTLERPKHITIIAMKNNK